MDVDLDAASPHQSGELLGDPRPVPEPGGVDVLDLHDASPLPNATVMRRSRGAFGRTALRSRADRTTVTRGGRGRVSVEGDMKLTKLIGSGDEIMIAALPFLVIGVILNVAFPSF